MGSSPARSTINASVAKLANAVDSRSAGRKSLRVQVPPLVLFLTAEYVGVVSSVNANDVACVLFGKAKIGFKDKKKLSTPYPKVGLLGQKENIGCEACREKHIAVDHTLS